MKFLCYYKILPGKGADTRAQWTGTEENWFGTTMLARYHAADGQHGVVIVEADDVSALSAWAMQWDSNITVDIHPCSEDDGALAAIQMGEG
jgi:hypothetical protein